MYTLPNDKRVDVKVEYQDAKGNAATVDGDVVWSSSDTNVATITPGDALGQVQITATADADLGDGVVEIICTMDVTVVGGQAVIGVISPVGATHA